MRGFTSYRREGWDLREGWEGREGREVGGRAGTTRREAGRRGEVRERREVCKSYSSVLSLFQQLGAKC